MEWVEITAKTIEEAKDQALDRLGVDERDAEFEVVEEPRAGIFGRTKGEARVRARVKPTAPRPKPERRDRRRDRPERAERPAGRNGNSANSTKDAPVIEDKTTSTSPDSGSAERVPSIPASAGRSRGRDVSMDRPTNDDLPDLDLAQQTEIVAEVVRGVVDALGGNATVAARQIDDDTAEVAVTGDQLGYLVGPRGRTLTALNEVTRSIVLRRGNTAPAARVHVDVSGYRQRRRDALAAFVTATAANVRESDLPHALEPMGSVDRKLVHDTVAEIDGVSSVSEGEDHDRRVIIVPA